MIVLAETRFFLVFFFKIMKAIITLENKKLRIWAWIEEDHPIQVSMTRESFAKIVMDKLMKRDHDCDVRDFTTEMWKEFDKILKDWPSEF